MYDAAQTDPPVPELPSLEPGIQLLADPKRGSGTLHSLVLDQTLVDGGTALWVDAHGHAVTQPLARVAPSDRVLDRIEVARGFTAYQHAALVETLPDRVDTTTSLLVLPAFDGQYRDDDRARDGEALFLRALATVAGVARRHDLPVLVTRYRDDDFAEPLANAAKRILTVEHTQFGPRFTGDDFETLLYPDGHATVQTTFAFWQRVLAERHPQMAADATATGVEVSHGTH